MLIFRAGGKFNNIREMQWALDELTKKLENYDHKNPNYDINDYADDLKFAIHGKEETVSED
jgi:hypothetical protein